MTYFQFAVLGLGLAAVYIGLATGLQLVYRATGIINFAQGAVAMWGAYVYARLRTDGDLVFPVGKAHLGNDVSKPTAVVIGLACAFVLGLLVHFLVFRPVRRAPALAQVVTSIGLMVALQSLATIRFGSNSLIVDSIVPKGSWHVFGTDISSRECVMTGIMLVIAALVWAYLRFSYPGRATRAAAENERGAILMGFSPNLLSCIAIVLGTVVSTVAVMMGSALTGLDPSNYTLLVVPALAVLLVARLESIGVICLAAIVLGAFQSIIGLEVTKSYWPKWAQSGLDQVVPFVVVMIILFAFGKRLPSRGTLQTVRLPDVSIPRLRLVPTLSILAACLVVIFATSGNYRFGFTTSIILSLMALSYVVITGYLGQISLAQSAFAGAAGFTLSKATESWGVPFPLSILLCALVAAALGMLVALPAFRIRGVQLAIVTIAAALGIERFVFNNYSLTPPQGNPIKDARLFGANLAVREGHNLARWQFSLTALVIVTLVVLLFVRLASGDTGRTFLAVRANERAAASAGIDVRLAKLMGFGISAFVAGVAGCLIGYSQGQLSAQSFSVFVGLQVLAIAYLGGITSFGGAAIAGVIAPLGILYTLLHQLFNPGDYYAMVSGFLLIITAILNPSGIAGKTREQAAWVRDRWALRRGGGSGGSGGGPAPGGVTAPAARTGASTSAATSTSTERKVATRAS